VLDYPNNDKVAAAETASARRTSAPADMRTLRAGTRKPWPGLSRLASGTHALALADQAVVSGASFLTTVMIGRWTDASQLGAYAIGYSILVSSLAVQESLISLPYSIQRHRPLGTPAEHAGGSLALSGLFSALGVVVLTATALALLVWGAGPELLAMTWALAGVMPFVLMREFGRRFAFAHLHISQALLLDAAAAAIQLGALGWLAWSGRMSAVTACAALGVACGLTAIGWLYLFRADFAIRRGQLRASLKQSWGLGKWLFGGQLTVQVQHYITYWLLVVIAGAAVTGVYTACMSVVAFANPLMLGVRNILAPRSVLAWKTGGGAGLRRQAIRDTLLLGVIMASFCLLVLFAGEDVMRFLYHGKEYDGHGHILTVLALAMLASAVACPPPMRSPAWSVRARSSSSARYRRPLPWRWCGGG
jgi:O-antigen/teichoic acid export membrane protein